MPPAKKLGTALWVYVVLSTLVVVGIAGARVLHVGGLGRGTLIARQFLTDLNGDGTDDVVFQSLYLGGASDLHLTAIDGATGSTLWVSDALLKRGQSEVVAAVPGGVLVVVGGTATLLEGPTGAARYQATLPEKAEAVCSVDGGFRVLGRDGQFYALDDKTGAVQAMGKAPAVADPRFAPPCSPLPNDSPAARGGTIRVSFGDDLGDPHPMRVDNMLRISGDPIDLLVGKRRSGTSVPMLAAMNSVHVLWTRDVPPSDAMNVVEGAPTFVTRTGDRALALYYKTSGEPRVAAFVLSSGQRLWDVGFSPFKDPAGGSIAANARYAYVLVARGAEQVLYRLSMDTGHVDWRQ